MANSSIEKQQSKRIEQLETRIRELEAALGTVNGRSVDEQYRLLADSITDIVSLHDMDGIFLYVSPSVERVTGWKPSNMIGQDSRRFIHPDDLETLVAELRHYRNSGENDVVEWRCLCKDGSYVWMESSLHFTNDPNGEPYRLTLSTRDITARKQTEAQLLESRHFIQQVADTAPYILYVYDIVNYKSVYLNQFASKMYGQDAVEQLREDASVFFEERLHPDDKEQFERFSNHWHTAEDEEIFSQEYRIKNKDGEWRWLRSYDVVFNRDDSGRVTQILGLAVDTTEQKQAEEAMRESEERFRQIAEHIHEVFYILDRKQGRIVYVSPAYETVWGRSRQALYDNPRDFTDAVYPDDLPDVLEGLRRETENSETFSQEYRITRPDGSIRWIFARNFPIYDEQGEIYRYAGIAEDITERKQMRSQHLALEIEKERTQILSNFIRSASHQFKTPLSIINSSVYLMTRAAGEEAERLNRYSQQVEGQVANISELVDILVTMSRLDSGAQFQRNLLDVNDIVRQTMATMQPIIEEKHLSLAFKPNNGLPPIIGDFEELYNALRHIIDNATRYTPSWGNITILTDRDNDEVMISIKDSGVGIDREMMSRIFERFYRGDLAQSTRGFGLGLPIARKIIEEHHGYIEVESEPGQGSTFYVILPAAQEPNQ